MHIIYMYKIINITPHGPDDGSVEPKRYSVDPLINYSFHLDRCYQFFYIYIYVCIIYMYKIYIYVYNVYVYNIFVYNIYV